MCKVDLMYPVKTFISYVNSNLPCCLGPSLFQSPSAKVAYAIQYSISCMWYTTFSSIIRLSSWLTRNFPKSTWHGHIMGDRIMKTTSILLSREPKLVFINILGFLVKLCLVWLSLLRIQLVREEDEEDRSIYTFYKEIIDY